MSAPLDPDILTDDLVSDAEALEVTQRGIQLLAAIRLEEKLDENTNDS